MRYPYVVFFRYDKYSDIDQFIIENADSFMATFFITNNPADLNKLFNPNHHLLVTYGGECRDYCQDVMDVIPDRLRYRWIHYTTLPILKTINHSLSYCLIHNSINNRIKTRPVYSMFTTCYKSYDKIIRAYNSLKVQTMKDWEWVIVDDSPEDDHFLFLRETFANESRARIYRRNGNSGSIGDVKNEAVSLCRGNYAMELDHDDEILPRVLEQTSKHFDENPEVGFVYMDFINIYENGSNFTYGNGVICRGYSGYYCQKYNGKWVYVCITPNVNNITLSHLTCCPNHPRIWRRSVLLDIGNYSEMLPICDDFEILLRTAVNTKMTKIHELGYVQYMNDGNNNFSLIRNAEINRLGPYFISPQFYDTYEVRKKMKELNAYEDPATSGYSKLWEKDNFEHKYCNNVVNTTYTTQYCVIGIDRFIKNLVLLKELYEDPKNDFILLDNKIKNEALWEMLDNYGMSRFKCYNLMNSTEEVMTNFFNVMYKSCETAFIMDVK
jgi:glycosyltransferase involved in cell wall biosynthesis